MIQELSKQVKNLTQEIAELKERLSVYENSNSPPSKNSLLYREMKRKRRDEEEEQQHRMKKERPGRKYGHLGVTQIFRPTRSMVHTMKRCPRCDSTKKLSIMSTEKRTVVDVPEPRPHTVTEHIVNVYRCSRCGADELIPESARINLPSSSVTTIGGGRTKRKRGNGVVTLGRNVLSTISLLWSVARLPQRKISYVLESLHGLSLSPATVGHTLQNISDSLEAFHEKVRKKIDGSKKANFDETGMPVAGRRGWIWVAATKRYAFVQVAMSRGADVLERCFPKFRGVATVDGWKSYRYFKRVQRCWAHPLREVEILSLRLKKGGGGGRGREEAEYLLSSLRRLFHETKSELREHRHPPPNRLLHDRQLRKLRYILSKRYSDADVVKFVSKLLTASRHLFTFTLHRGLEPTNNHAERQLREPIVHRKIRGQLKSEKGIQMFSRLMTAVATWKLQNLNPFAEFRRYL